MEKEELEAIVQDLKIEIAVVHSLLDALEVPKCSHLEDRFVHFIRVASFGVPEELVLKAWKVYHEIPY